VSAETHDDEPLLTVAEAAANLRVSVKTIYKYIDAGLLKAIRLPHGRWRIFQSSVKRIRAS
jgi:excisionase family DNA binding protein